MMAAEEVVQVSKPEEVYSQRKIYDNKVHTTLFSNPLDGKQYKIIARHSPMIAVQKILNHNKARGYTGILNAGESGTGKTTWTKYLVHQLHQKKESVVVKWFYKAQLKNFVQIVHKLEKGIDHIIVFDDVSFSLEDLPKEKLLDLEKTLTYIRHIVKANVIVVMNVHYSKAIQKFFRATTQFRYLSSLSNEEVQSYEDLFGSYSKYKLRDFARMNDHMVMRGTCVFEISRWAKKYVTYQFQKPFGLLFASEGNEIRFTVYLRDSCHVCDEEYETKRVMNEDEMLGNLEKKYGIPRVRAIVRHYMHAMKGMNTLESHETALWRSLAEADKANKIDWDEVDKIVKKKYIIPRSRSYIKKSSQQHTMNLIRQATSPPVQVTPNIVSPSSPLSSAQVDDSQPVQVPDVLEDDERTFDDTNDENLQVESETDSKTNQNPFIDNSQSMDYDTNTEQQSDSQTEDTMST